MSGTSTLERPRAANDPAPLAPTDRAEQALFEEARQRRRRRWGYGIAALVILAVVGAGAGIGFGGGPGSGAPAGSGAGGAAAVGASRVPRSALPDIGATPKGWAPIPLTGIQISVPSSWLVVQGGSPGCGGGGATDVLFLGERPDPRETSCLDAKGVVSLRRGRPGGVVGSGRYLLVHGLPVRLYSRGRTEVAGVAGMVVTARGPEAMRVIRTITRSPRSVVLGPYTASIPKGWRQVTFEGLRFSVPGRWVTGHWSSWGECPEWPRNVNRTSLELSTGKNGVNFLPSCPLSTVTAGIMAARPGMVVGAGPIPMADRPSTGRHVRCFSQHGLRICAYRPHWTKGGVLSSTYSPGVLTADVYLPGGTKVDGIEVGLSGSGLTPLAIVRSLRPAR